jgi:murein L,D-transpeptidase YcbB/YkuD
MIDFLSKNEEELRTSLTSQTGKAIDKVGLEGTKNIKVIDTTEATRKSFLEDSFEKQKTKIEGQDNKIQDNKPLKSLSNSIAPTLDDVRSGKKVIKKGQKGGSVKEIQKMLYSIGYDFYVSDGGNISKWDDGNYGESTELAVLAFQKSEDLDMNGSVGVETLNKLMEKYDEKNVNNRNK